MKNKLAILCKEMFIYILKEADSFFFCFRGDEDCPMGGGLGLSGRSLIVIFYKDY